MSNIPSDLKYAKSHEWVRVSGDTATVGITDHAQHELTDIVFVELPAVGRQVKAGEACAVVESVKTASDIYSPVSGEITAVNAAVAELAASTMKDMGKVVQSVLAAHKGRVDGKRVSDAVKARLAS